jgi:hypothetical protein
MVPPPVRLYDSCGTQPPCFPLSVLACRHLLQRMLLLLQNLQLCCICVLHYAVGRSILVFCNSFTSRVQNPTQSSLKE